jgi:PAS domain-containing protein
MWCEIDGALIVDRFTLPACEVDAQLRVIAVNRPFCEAFKYSEDRIAEAVTLDRLLGSSQVERIRDLLSNEDEHIRVAPFSAAVLSGAGQSIKCQIHLGLTGNASTRLGLLFFLPCIDTDCSNLATNDCLHNDRMEKFWKSLPNGVIAVTTEGRVEDFNDAAVSTLEYLPCELRHKGIDTICPELSPFEH